LLSNDDWLLSVPYLFHENLSLLLSFEDFESLIFRRALGFLQEIHPGFAASSFVGSMLNYTPKHGMGLDLMMIAFIWTSYALDFWEISFLSRISYESLLQS
jgi:hypothetical protein